MGRAAWLAWLVLGACGGPEPHAAPRTAAHVDEGEPESARAAAEGPAEQTPSEPAAVAPAECVAGPVRTLAHVPEDDLWAVAAGAQGYALAYCDAEARVAVQLLDGTGAPEGEPRTLAEPCVEQAPRIAAVGDRWVVSTLGACTARAHRTRCWRSLTVSADGATVGPTLLGAQQFGTVAATPDALHSHWRGYARNYGEERSSSNRLEVTADGALLETRPFQDGARCWTGPCIAGEGERVIGLSSEGFEDASFSLWRSWAEPSRVLVRGLPGLQRARGSVFRLCDDAAWLAYFIERDGADVVLQIARIDLETGQAQRWLDQLAPGPAMPSCTDPTMVPQEGGGAVQWRDLRGAPVGDPVPIELAEASILGDSRSAFATHRASDGSILGTRVSCRSAHSGTRQANSPRGAITARVSLDWWPPSLIVDAGRVGVETGGVLRWYSLLPPDRIRVPEPHPLQSVARPSSLAVRLAGSGGASARVTLNSDSLLVRIHSRPQVELEIDGARALTTDAAHAYVGSASAIVRVPIEARPLAVDATITTGGLAVVDLARLGHVLYAALAGTDRGAVVAIDTRSGFRELGRVALAAPAVAIDASRAAVVVATAGALHPVEREEAGLTLGAAVRTRPVHDLAVSRTGVFTVGPGGQVLQHALGGDGLDRELAPAQGVRGTEERWLLRATGDRLWRAGEDLAVIVVP